MVVSANGRNHGKSRSAAMDDLLAFRSRQTLSRRGRDFRHGKTSELGHPIADRPFHSIPGSRAVGNLGELSIPEQIWKVRKIH